ncbi:hypothetical protein F4819DRAFT_486979 [Hypoxylon fuscum]|nr:hypothetical protein F4819DRAFT_486979 [Hypoxylon fuscum]
MTTQGLENYSSTLSGSQVLIEPSIEDVAALRPPVTVPSDEKQASQSNIPPDDRIGHLPISNVEAPDAVSMVSNQDQPSPMETPMDTRSESSLPHSTSAWNTRNPVHSDEGIACHDGQAQLFENTINSADPRVSTAIEWYVLSLAYNFYYLMLPLFNVAEDIEITLSTEVSIPMRWDGLIVVLVMVFVNLVCVLTITTLYVKHVRYSRQGHFLHTVSQLMSEPMQPNLKGSSEMDDEEVAKEFKGNDPFVIIGRSPETGRVEVLKVHEQDSATPS